MLSTLAREALIEQVYSVNSKEISAYNTEQHVLLNLPTADFVNKKAAKGAKKSARNKALSPKQQHLEKPFNFGKSPTVHRALPFTNQLEKPQTPRKQIKKAGRLLDTLNNKINFN